MIEKAIHEILADNSNPDAVALLQLIPINRIVTGTSHDHPFPYANVNIESNQANYRSNGGSAREPRVRIQIWHETHSVGVQIRKAFETLFEKKTFAADGMTIDTWHENTIAIEEDDGVWQFLIDIKTLVK